MKISEIRPLSIPDVKVLRYARFADERGYFTETYRKSDFFSHAGAACFEGIEFKQCNESRSRAGVGCTSSGTPARGSSCGRSPGT
jgi:dTDP-4-dehydrorhamnose 3,5-epimerase-like enzyme